MWCSRVTTNFCSSIHRKLASVVAETSYHAAKAAMRTISKRWIMRALSPTHHDACSRRAQQYCGQKSLTGEGYRRPRCRDTEVFLPPFHLFSEPTIARKFTALSPVITTRAGESATQRRSRARYFPWERAAAKKRRRNLPPLTFAPGCGKKWTLRGEHHLVADIAWAKIHQYWRPRGVKVLIAWRRRHGALPLETAKFWISRSGEG